MFKSLFTVKLILIVVALSLFISSTSLAADTDPTRPFGVGGTMSSGELRAEEAFKLTSIVHGDGIHTAVINGKIYNMFDYIGEYRITAINSHSVILRNKSKRLKVNIFKHKGFKSNVVANTVAN